MVKSIYAQIREQWKKPNTSYKSPQHQRLIEWRQEKNFFRVEKPLRIDRARSLGYKSKQGYIIVRAKIRRGGLRKHHIRSGRRPAAKGITKITAAKSTKRIAEERSSKKFPNLEVLNSYWIGEDGKNHYYEVILVDPFHPSIINDSKINWICYSSNKRRVLRGKTSAGRKGRGLYHKGRGAEKIRPSIRANAGRGK